MFREAFVQQRKFCFKGVYGKLEEGIQLIFGMIDGIQFLHPDSIASELFNRIQELERMC